MFDSGNSPNNNGLSMEATLNNIAIPHKSLFPELSFYTRIKFFVGLILLSLLLTVLAFCFMIISLKSFAMLYTLATISCLFSLFFLVGPMEQIKSMVQWTRVVATLLLAFFIMMTLVAAMKWKNSLMAIIFSICQFGSFAWYALSYIPYARTIAKHFCSATCSCCI